MVKEVFTIEINKKTGLFTIAIVLVLVLGGFAIAQSEPDDYKITKISEPSTYSCQQGECGGNCDGSCGGNCGVPSCGCGR